MRDIKAALITGADISLDELQIVLHQPSAKEIAYIGYDDFLLGAQLLCVDKNFVIQDKTVLESTTNFQIFMKLMFEAEDSTKSKRLVTNTCSLLFPNSQISFTPQSIILKQGDSFKIIGEDNFEIIQEYIKQVLQIGGKHDEGFHPAGSDADKIAKKLMNARSRVAKQNGEENAPNIIQIYISALSIALGLSIVELSNYTLFMLYDSIERYNLWMQWDLYTKTCLAGGKPNDKPENWMKNIH